MDRIIDITEVYRGDSEYRGVCISADTRPNRSHAWTRAAIHAYHFKDLPFDVQRRTAVTCMFLSGRILVDIATGKLGLGAPVKWGWGKGWPGQ